MSFFSSFFSSSQPESSAPAEAIAEPSAPVTISSPPPSPSQMVVTLPESSDLTPKPDEFDPLTFVPTLSASPHLEFVEPEIEETDLEEAKERLKRYETLCEGNKDPVLVAYIKPLMLKLSLELEAKIKEAKEVAHRTNAHRLAERVIHKYLKWGPVRFGKTDNCQADFYDGSTKVDKPILFDTYFYITVLELSLKQGLDGQKVMGALHAGETSLKRFSAFMKIADAVPPTPVGSWYMDP